GRSLSEEIEHRLFRDLLDDIDQTRADTRRVLSSAYVQALRLAGFSLLRDVEGQPTRVIIDVGMLHGEADGILRSAFTAQEQAPRQESRPMTAEEGERLAKEIEEIKATLKAVVEKTLAGGKAGGGDKPDGAEGGDARVLGVHAGRSAPGISVQVKPCGGAGLGGKHGRRTRPQGRPAPAPAVIRRRRPLVLAGRDDGARGPQG